MRQRQQRAGRTGLPAGQLAIGRLLLAGLVGLFAAGPSWADDEIEILSRGPVHEAFAEPVSYGAERGLTVDRQPPPPIEEVAPDQMPEGDPEWIPGYWGWDDDRKDFLWISGVWRVPPPGFDWVPGYWQALPDGRYEWVSGTWQREREDDEVEYLPQPPATVERGPSSPQPRDDSFWVPGHWTWRAERYLWQPGYWAIHNPDWMWVPAHYAATPSGCLFVPGYWDLPVARRGMVFAPIYVPRRVVAARVSFTPSVVISTAHLNAHLFSRPAYGHYYFGDYYEERYVSVGIVPSYRNYHSRVCYDPLFSFSACSYRGVGIDYYRQSQDSFLYFSLNIGSRPPRRCATAVFAPAVARNTVIQNNVGNTTVVNNNVTNVVNNTVVNNIVVNNDSFNTNNRATAFAAGGRQPRQVQMAQRLDDLKKQSNVANIARDAAVSAPATTESGVAAKLAGLEGTPRIKQVDNERRQQLVASRQRTQELASKRGAMEAELAKARAARPAAGTGVVANPQPGAAGRPAGANPPGGAAVAENADKQAVKARIPKLNRRANPQDLVKTQPGAGNPAANADKPQPGKPAAGASPGAGMADKPAGKPNPGRAPGAATLPPGVTSRPDATARPNRPTRPGMTPPAGNPAAGTPPAATPPGKPADGTKPGVKPFDGGNARPNRPTRPGRAGEASGSGMPDGPVVGPDGKPAPRVPAVPNVPRNPANRPAPSNPPAAPANRPPYNPPGGSAAEAFRERRGGRAGMTPPPQAPAANPPPRRPTPPPQAPPQPPKASPPPPRRTPPPPPARPAPKPPKSEKPKENGKSSN